MSFWFFSSAVLLLGLTGLRRALRGRVHPLLQYALWALALLRLLIPGAVFSSPASLENLTARTQIVRDLEALRGIESLSLSDGSALGFYGGDYERDSPVVLADEATPERFARLSRAMNWRDALTAVWLAGVCAVGGAFLVSNLSFAARLRRSRRRLEAPGSLLPVYVCDGLAAPCLFGLLRPAIYLTPEAASDETRLRHVLAHEETHYRHGDTLWGALRGLALALHWFDPLAWLCAALSRRDAEAACDAGAIRRLGEEARTDYGKTLIGLTVKKAGRFELLCCATTMTGGKKALRERVTLLARRPKTRLAALLAVIAVVIVALVCLFTGAKQEPAAPPEDVPEPVSVPDMVQVGDSFSSTLLLEGITDPDTVAELWRLYRQLGSAGEAVEPDYERLHYGMIDVSFYLNDELIGWVMLWGPYGLSYDGTGEGELSFHELPGAEELYDAALAARRVQEKRQSDAVPLYLTARVETDLGDGFPDAPLDWALELLWQDMLYQEQLGAEALHGEYHVTDGKLTGLQALNTGWAYQTDALACNLQIYRVEWRILTDHPENVMLAGGMRMEDGWLTEMGSTGGRYIVLAVFADGHWERIAPTNEDRIVSEYSTPEMIGRYGNPYSAACACLFLDWKAARESAALLKKDAAEFLRYAETADFDWAAAAAADGEGVMALLSGLREHAETHYLNDWEYASLLKSTKGLDGAYAEGFQRVLDALYARDGRRYLEIWSTLPEDRQGRALPWAAFEGAEQAFGEMNLASATAWMRAQF